MPSLVRTAAVAAALMMTTVGLTACLASPPQAQSPTPTSSRPPVAVEELGAGEQDAGVDVAVDGPTQVAFRRITIAPGAGTGLHCHAGQLVAVVEQGALTHYAPIYPDGVHVYETGDSIVEGAEYVHEGVNLGDVDVVLLVTYIIEEGQPLAQTDLDRCARP